MLCISAQSFAPSWVTQPAEEGPEPTSAADAVPLCAPAGGNKAAEHPEVSSWPLITINQELCSDQT